MLQSPLRALVGHNHGSLDCFRHIVLQRPTAVRQQAATPLVKRFFPEGDSLRA
jgi:hypothetical protein